jgi:RNA polymerase sigma factor (sigma-70 family)
VAAAVRGDEDAWAALVARYTPLVWGVVRRFRLDRADAADVNQTVWLRLVEHLPRLREPAALPMWIAKTTRHECLRVLRASRNTLAMDPLDVAGEAYWARSALLDAATVDDELLRAELHQALREAFDQLGPRCQELLTWLLLDPMPSYEEIGARMGMPVGSVGPTRGRCLDKLRRCPALAAITGDRPVSIAAKLGAEPATRRTTGTGSGRDDHHEPAAVGR